MRRVFGLTVLLVALVLPVSAQLWPRVIVQCSEGDTTYATRLGGKPTAETEVLVEDFEGYKNIYGLNNRVNGIRWLNVATPDRISSSPVISGNRSLLVKDGKVLSTCDIPGLLSVNFNYQSNFSFLCYTNVTSNSQNISPSASTAHIVYSVPSATKSNFNISISSGDFLLDDVQFTVQRREYLYTDFSSESTYSLSPVTVTYKDFSGSVISSSSPIPPYNLPLPNAPERVGYTFVGWLVSLDNGQELLLKDGTVAPYVARLFPANEYFLVSQSVTFTAQYINCDHCFQVSF